MTSEPHIPVLMEEALDALALKPGGRYLDGTFGAGGYSRALLEREPKATLIAIQARSPAVPVSSRRWAGG